MEINLIIFSHLFFYATIPYLLLIELLVQASGIVSYAIRKHTIMQKTLKLTPKKSEVFTQIYIVFHHHH